MYTHEKNEKKGEHLGTLKATVHDPFTHKAAIYNIMGGLN